VTTQTDFTIKSQSADAPTQWRLSHFSRLKALLVPLLLQSPSTKSLTLQL